MSKENNYSVLFLCFIVVIFLFFAKVFIVPNNNISPVGLQVGVQISDTQSQKDQSLQLHKLPIVTPTLTPTSTPTLAAGVPTTDCSLPAGIGANQATLVSTISKTFGINLSGNGLNLARAQLTYETMCLAFHSPTYQKNLNSLQHPISVSFVNKGTCFAWSYANPPRTQLWEPCPTLVDKYILIHELTHVMQYGASLGRNAHFSAWQSQVWSKEKNHRIPTGPCVYEDPGDGGECEADAIAEYIYYKSYRNSWGGKPAGSANLANYPTAWPLWYNFVKTSIFGGTSY